jgi:hypothetical protein
MKHALVHALVHALAIYTCAAASMSVGAASGLTLRVEPPTSQPLLSEAWKALGGSFTTLEGGGAAQRRAHVHGKRGEPTFTWLSSEIGDDEINDDSLCNRVEGMEIITRKPSLAEAAAALSWRFTPQHAETATEVLEPYGWVAKSATHGNVGVLAHPDADAVAALLQGGALVQRRVAHPLLVDGHAFDVGMYVLVRHELDHGADQGPLQYAIFADLLLRFCADRFLGDAEAEGASPEVQLCYAMLCYAVL